MNSYFAYGLHIHSPFPLPDLPPGGDKPDVVFLLDRVEKRQPEQGYPSFRTDSGDIFVSIYKVAQVLIKKGRHVIIDPLPGVDERVLRIYLLGMVMGVLLHQWGKHAFHASAVTLLGEAIAFMGTKCMGKSSTAAHFHAAGCGLITDDLLALSQENGSLMVTPGIAQIKLMPDAARHLQQIPDTCETVHPVLQKHPHCIVSGFVRKPTPLKKVYILQESETNDIVPLHPKKAVKEVLPHWYSAQFGIGMIQALGAQDFLSQCAVLAEQVPIALLKRRHDLEVFPELLDLVRRDLGKKI